MSALRVMNPPIRTNSHHPTLASAQPVVEEHSISRGSLKISFHFHFGGRGTSHHRDWLSRHKRLWLVTCHWHQQPEGPSASPPEKPLARLCTYVTCVWIRPSPGLSHLPCPQLIHPQEFLPRIHRCVPAPHRCVGTNSSLRSFSGRSVADLSTQKGATWGGASARNPGGLPVSLPDQLARDNCRFAGQLR